MKSPRCVKIPGICWLLLAVSAACDCRSDVEVANETLEQARELSAPAPSPVAAADPWGVEPVDAPGDPCARSPGSLVVATANGILADLQVAGDTVYWAGSAVFSHDGAHGARELFAVDWQVRSFVAAEPGIFLVTQSETGPTRTRLLFRAAGGETDHAFERDDVLLNDLVAVDDGVFALVGRVLASDGGASQLLHYAHAGGRERVVLDRERGASYLTHDDTHLYWIEYPQTGRGQRGDSAIVAFPLEAGPQSAPRVVTAGAGAWSDLAVGSAHLYWILRDRLEDPAGRLMRIPKRGSDPELVHPSVRSGALFVHEDEVYAHVSGADGADEARRRLYRVAPSEPALVLEDRYPLERPRLSDGVAYWSTASGPRGTDTVRCIRSLPLPEQRATIP